MDLFESFVRVLFDPDGIAMTLLDYGDPLWEPLAFDGSQVIQEVALVRALGIRAMPRGNERHAVAFAIARIEATLYDAFASRLTGTIALPRDMADVLIALEDGRQWRLKNAAVSAWPGSQEEFIGREGVQLIGGNLEADAGVYVPGSAWNYDTEYWEE